MKILLIDTPFNIACKNDPPRVYLSQAQLFLATSLQKNGFQVSIYDPKVSCKKNFNKELGVFYVGDSFDEIEERVRQEKPDMVGITNLFSKDFNNAVEIALRVKKVNSGIQTIVGGFHSTLAPGDFLEYPVFDFAVMGEGENVVVEIASKFEKQNNLFDIEGLAYKNQGKIITKNEPGQCITNLDDLGFPDYSLVDLEKYFKLNSMGLGARPLSGGKRSISVITSRGCPYKCFFCNANKIHGYKFRSYSAKVILEHIHRLIKVYKIDYIEFEDDNLSFDRARFKEIVKGICDLDKKMKWGTPNGVRADTLLDRNLLKLVKKSGCEYITVGVESGNQEFLNRVIKKRLDLKHVVELASLCREVGLPMNAFFIIGFPHEKLWQIRETLEFAMMLNKKYDVYPFINFAIPIKGTEMYDECIKNGFLTEDITPKSLVESSSFRGRGKITTPEFTPEFLSELMVEFNKQIFRNSLIKGICNPIIGFRFAKSALRNFSHFKRYVLG